MVPFRLLRPLSVLALSAIMYGPALASDQDAKNAAPSIETSLKEAQAKRLSGDFPGAVKILSQLMLVNADDGRVVAEYGKVLVSQGRTREALDFLQRAVQLSANDWTLYSALGTAFDATGDYASAKTSYDRALQLKPGEAIVLNNYALSRAQAGDLVMAKSLITQASGKSQDPRVARNLAMITALTPTVPVTENKPAAPAVKTVSTNTANVPTGAPRPLTSSEGKQVVMQAVPADANAGPVKKDRKTAAATTPAKPDAKSDKPAKNGVPALRLANDRL